MLAPELSRAPHASGAPEQLQTIRTVADPLEQLYLLDAVQVDPATQADYAAAMYNFAEDEAASRSLLVRSYALQCCVSTISSGMVMTAAGDTSGQPFPDHLTAFYQDIHKTVETYRATIQHTTDLEDPRLHAASAKWFLTDVAVSEGLPPELFRPNYSSELRHYPTFGFQLMDWFIDSRTNQRPKVAQRASVPTFERAAYDDMLDSEFSKLTELLQHAGTDFEGRDIYGGLAHELRHSVPPEKALDCAQTLNNLYESVNGLKDVFPPELSQDITNQALTMAAQVFSVVAHCAKGGTVRERLNLINREARMVQFEGDEPLLLLKQLDSALRKLRHAVTAEDSQPIVAARGEGFTMYRFIDITAKVPPSVLLYIRPQGAYRYDQSYEYGRKGKGVEASISYTVQLGDDAPIALAKDARRADAISIRLDREAHDDPASQNGRISLDIGSIAGVPGVFGTRIAKLLSVAAMHHTFLHDGLGDHGETNLNHAPLYAGRQFGQADYFAGSAARLDNHMRQRCLNATAMRRIYSAALYPQTSAATTKSS